MSFILESATDVIAKNETNTTDFLRLKMNFSLSLADSENKDTLESEVIFTKSSLSPIWMHKKAVIAPRPNTINDSYELEICYNENYYCRNYHEEYTSPKGYYSQYSFDNGNISELNIKNGDYYDNEELFFVIRSMTDLKTGASLSVYITNGYEMFNQNKFFTYLISVVCGSSTVNVKMNDTITAKFSDEKLAVNEDEKLVPCILANAYINDKNRGAPIILYYAANPFDSPNTGFCLMKMETSEYNSDTRSLAYKTTYELTDYRSR